MAPFIFCSIIGNTFIGLPGIPQKLSMEQNMSQFDKVSVVREANIYFDGKVTSRTILFADGSKKTLGVMLPGEYEFGTDEAELMEILSGELEIRLPGENWRSVKGGESFEVPKQSKFALKIFKPTDYCCSYLK